MADINITLDSKQLYPSVINLKQFSSGTDVLTFVMDNFMYETTDLSKMDAYAVCDMVNESVDEVKLEKQIVEGKLKLKWTVTGYTTQLDGHISYQIVFKDIANEKAKLWFSHMGIIFVNSSINADGKIAADYPTILQQWERRMNEVDSTATNAANVATEQAKIATQKATEASQSAVKAQNEATDAEESANKTEEMKKYIEELINFEPTNIFEREVTEARGEFPLLGNRLDKLDEDISNKSPSVHTHTKSQIIDFPTKLSQFSNDNKYQTETQVKQLIDSLVNSAPETLDTLKELADALGNDPNFATTITNMIGTKADKTYVDTELEKKAQAVHTHDDRYYTETEMNTKLSAKLDNTGNASNVTNTFTQATTLANLTTGEKLSVSLGKVSKAIADFIAHIGNKNNPHAVTKVQIGLGNVPNVTTNNQTPTYSDSSSLTTLSSGETLSIAFGKIKVAITNLINHIANKSNPHSVTKSHVGLGNVDNTSDLNKPISTAVQTALNGKSNTSHTHTKSQITDFPLSLKNPNSLKIQINGVDKTSYDGSVDKTLNIDIVPVGSITMFAGSVAPEGFLICDGKAISRTTYENLFKIIGSTYGNGDGTTTFNIPNLKGKIPVGLDSNDNDFKTLGKTGGEKTHQLTLEEIPSHNHTASTVIQEAGSHTHGASSLDSGSHSHSISGTANSAGDHGHTVRLRKIAYGTGGMVSTIGFGDDYNSTGNSSIVNAGSHTHSLSGSAASAGTHKHTISVNSGGSHTHTGTTSVGSSGGGKAHNNLQPYVVLNYIIKY